MKREITDQLCRWKESKRRKPLLLTGVRQCGKTTVLKSFGEKYYGNTVYLNFEENERLAGIFEYNFDSKRILQEIRNTEKAEILPGSTLLIFDEIQECPRAITALKYFCENLREYHIACAGSLLGVALKREAISFPVGKVNRLQMYPLNFREFVLASGEELLLETLKSWPVGRPIPDLYFTPMKKLLKEYYLTGGMPEAVAEWVESHDLSAVEEILDEILQDYADDFAKHAPPEEAEKIRWLWESIPVQLGKENNKFIFSHVRSGKRAADLENALQWLSDAGLVRKLELVEKPELPLSSASDAGYFKVYLSDIGLLRRRSGLAAETILTDHPLFLRYKGSFAENYVLNELVSQKESAYFWRSGNAAEVDLLLEKNGELIPVEVKSAENTQAKSYRQFCSSDQPRTGFKFSIKNIGESCTESTRTDRLPLFLVWNWQEYLETEVPDRSPEPW